MNIKYKTKNQLLIELIFSQKELIIQEKENKKRADEVIVANIELAFQNVEKEKRADELIVANKELVFQNVEKEKRANELIIAKNNAEKSNKLKSAFLANMSHEIRTPLNGILGFTSLLKQAEITEKERQNYIQIIEESGARLLSIINDIISISKIESDLMVFTTTKTKINEQLEYIYSFFKFEVESKGIEFSLIKTLSDKEAIINTDSEKLYAILINLVKNAIKFTSKGSIKIGYIKKDGYIEFYVKDSGIGIPKARQEAIFERFIQADPTNIMAHQGAGLGLSISKAYVEMLDGKIWIKSTVDEGSIFYFKLPYNPPPEEDIVIKKIVHIEKIAVPLNLKILFVEDDKISEFLFDKISKIFGKKILKARTGIEAIEICLDNPDIDLILMDIQMPQMNGYDATLKIRKFNTDVIIIAQTAYTHDEAIEKINKCGFNDYISKPINKDNLYRIIQNHFKPLF
jgi:hypothetical protein